MKKNNNIVNIFFGILLSTIVLVPIVSLAAPDGSIVSYESSIGAPVNKDPPVQVGNKAEAPKSDLFQKILGEQGKYKFIVPLGPFASVVSDTTDLTTGTALVDYLRTWFKFLIGIAGIIAVAKLVYLGFQIIVSSSSVDAKSLIRKQMTSTVIAFLFVAMSWVFLNTLNPALVNSSTLLTPVTTNTNAAKVVYHTDDVNTADEDVITNITGNGYFFVITDGKVKRNVGPFPDETTCVKRLGTVKYTLPWKISSQKCYLRSNYNPTVAEKSLRTFIAQANVYANKDGCSFEDQTDCTRLEGLETSPTLSTVIFLARKFPNSQPKCTKEKAYSGNTSDCTVVITGGTEAGHASHGRGIQVYDLRYNDTLDTFFKTNASVIAESFGGFTRYLYGNTWFTDEKYAGKTRHFHVCVINNGAKPKTACGTYNTSNCKETIKLPDGTMQKNCR